MPVFMSSLLQVPFAQQLIGPDNVVGILFANESAVREKHLEAAGIRPGSNYVIGGAMGSAPSSTSSGRSRFDPTRRRSCPSSSHVDFSRKIFYPPVFSGPWLTETRKHAPCS